VKCPSRRTGIQVAHSGLITSAENALGVAITSGAQLKFERLVPALLRVFVVVAALLAVLFAPARALAGAGVGVSEAVTYRGERGPLGRAGPA